MSHPLVEYFRCPEHLGALRTATPLSAESGYFKFAGAVCYGRHAARTAAPRPDGDLGDVERAVSFDGGRGVLPFDLAEILDNLRRERYPALSQSAIARLTTTGAAHALYYFFRPLLGVGVRKHLQKLRLSGWKRIPFPSWPVDVTVETLMKSMAGLVLESQGAREFPFIWFWPDGASGCVMVTHDVEGPAGARRAGDLMDIDDAFGIRSAFQLVPEAKTSRALLEQCRRRCFEVNVHDFNHDGHLFRDKRLFDRRIREINRYVREYGCRGFRSGAMKRRQDWFSAFEFAYDMSVPNVAHLEPQQGGCCTVMPHFIGDVLELPLTTTQDYSLFHVLDDYSIALWQEQIELILAENGLVSVIVHPDYLVSKRERDVYLGLLRHLSRLRRERSLWVAPPSDIDTWWRDRRQMHLLRDGDGWRIEGPGAERASVAVARLDRGTVAYDVMRARRAA